MTVICRQIILLSCLVCIACSKQNDADNTSSQNTTPIQPVELAGSWYAEPIYADTVGHVAFEIERNQEGQFEARLSLLDINAADIPVGNVTHDGRQLQIGPVTFTLSLDNQSFSGFLPPSIVPVHDIPMTFHKVPTVPPLNLQQQPLPQVQPAWAFATGGAVWGGIAYHDRHIYFGSDDGHVYAVEASTGAEVWRFDTGAAIRARPVIANGNLLVQSDNGYLYRLDIDTGNEAWKSRLQLNLKPRLSPDEPGFQYDYYASAAIVQNGQIYTGSADGSLYALNEQTGAVNWSFATQSIITTTPAVSGSQVVTGSHDGKVYALNADSGSLLWKYDTGAAVTSSPAIAEGLVIIGSRSYDILGLSLADGDLEWNRYYWFSWVESSPVINTGTVFIGSSDAQLLSAFRTADGELQWQFDTGGSAWAQPAVNQRAVFIGAVGVADYIVDHQAGFYAIDLHTGTGLWQLVVEQSGNPAMWGFASAAAIGPEHVFVGNLNGSVYAIGISDLKDKHQF